MCGCFKYVCVAVLWSVGGCIGLNQSHRCGLPPPCPSLCTRQCRTCGTLTCSRCPCNTDHAHLVVLAQQSKDFDATTQPPSRHVQGDTNFTITCRACSKIIRDANSLPDESAETMQVRLCKTAHLFLFFGPQQASSKQRKQYEKSLVAWIPDLHHGETCAICAGEFSFLNRRHHCRMCGALTCSKCPYKTRHRDLLLCAKQSKAFKPLHLQALAVQSGANIITCRDCNTIILATVHASQTAASGTPDRVAFQAASKFDGSRPGFVFHLGSEGLGYYLDGQSERPSSTIKGSGAGTGTGTDPGIDAAAGDEADNDTARQAHIINKMAQHLDSRCALFAIGSQHQTTGACVLLSDPSTFGTRGPNGPNQHTSPSAFGARGPNDQHTSPSTFGARGPNGPNQHTSPSTFGARGPYQTTSRIQHTEV